MAVPAFLSGEAKGGAKTFLKGASLYGCQLANNALPQYGTHTPLFQVPLPFPRSFFSLCFLRFLSFPSLFHSHLPLSPPFIQLGVYGSAVSSPAVPGGARDLKWAFSNISKWQTAVFSKLTYRHYITVLVSSQMWYSLMWVSKTPIPTWFWSYQRRFPLLKNWMVKIKKLKTK